MKKHLAIFDKETIKQIFAGVKKVDGRFSQKKISPFGKVSIGDLVYIKPPGEEIVGQFRVKKVISLEGLDKDDWQLVRSYIDEHHFKDKHDIKYCTLIFIDRVEQFITSPVKIQKSDQRGWMVLSITG